MPAPFEVLFITSVDYQIAVLKTVMCIVMLPISFYFILFYFWKCFYASHVVSTLHKSL